MRGNVLDMAVGIIIGAAFGTIASSLVNDIIMPPIGIVLGNIDFKDTDPWRCSGVVRLCGRQTFSLLHNTSSPFNGKLE